MNIFDKVLGRSIRKSDLPDVRTIAADFPDIRVVWSEDHGRISIWVVYLPDDGCITNGDRHSKKLDERLSEAGFRTKVVYGIGGFELVARKQ